MVEDFLLVATPVISSKLSLLRPLHRPLLIMSLKRKAADSVAAGEASISSTTAVSSSPADAASSSKDAKKPKVNSSITSFFGQPKDTKSEAFDKTKWVAGLSAEQKELLKLEIDTLHESWLAHLKDEILKPEFLALKRFLKKEKESKQVVFPPEQDIYSWYAPSHLTVHSPSLLSCSLSILHYPHFFLPCELALTPVQNSPF